MCAQNRILSNKKFNQANVIWMLFWLDCILGALEWRFTEFDAVFFNKYPRASCHRCDDVAFERKMLPRTDSKSVAQNMHEIKNIPLRQVFQPALLANSSSG